MDPSRWALVESLCDAALALDPPQRDEFLVRSCGGDPTLLAEVRDLLRHIEADPSFLEHPAAVLDAAAHGESSPQPDLIGRWQVLRQLGTGGMGEVYLGESREDGRQVAIKVLRRNARSEDLARRFVLESRILAALQHPGIARLIEVAETGDGRPCFVLEYVAGLPITTWADLHRLRVRDRIELVISVAGAVAHAHRSLVVHRDIKPGNILVTESGEAKLLDFGIGKVLDHSGGLEPVIQTADSARLLTLDYAAPEQLRGELIGTATDVHALGILLYELLSGVHPFRREGDTPAAVESAILERVPDRPSAVVRPAPASGPVAASDAAARAEARGASSPEQLGHRLAGDLDNIILKALRKEPERRYHTVQSLAEDLRRHLDGMPVTARPDTLGYRARKFVRRHAGSVAIATLMVLGLIGTTATALLQSHRASRAVAAARAERDEAVAVRSFLMETYGATGSGDAVGASETVRQLIDRQAARIDEQYADRPALAARLHEVVADAYDRLGLPADAVGPARRAVELRSSSQGHSHPDLAASHNLLGWVLHQSGNRSEAEAHLDSALASRRGAAPVDSSGLARTLNDLGVLYNATERAARAETVLSEALAIRRATGGDEQLGVGITANNLAAAQYFQQRLPEARETQALALHALERSVGPDHQRSVIALGNLAAFKLAAGDIAGAERDYRELLDRQQRLQGRQHPVTLRVMTSLAAALLRREGETRSAALAEAEALTEEALRTQDSIPGHGLPHLAVTLERLASIRLAQGDTAAARQPARRTITTLTVLHGAEDSRTVRMRERFCAVLGEC